jgi:hypothetical protein
MKGDRYERSLLNTSEGSIGFVSAGTIIIEEAIDCHCVTNNTLTECDSRAPGSNGCEITDGGGVASANWNHHCQVSCNGGYYACCTE